MNATLLFPDYETAVAAAKSLGFWDDDSDTLRTSGQTIEILEAMAPAQAMVVTDLVDVVHRVDGMAQHRQPNNWASVSQQRGFVAMVGHLLDSVRAGEVLDGADALATHDLCEEILRHVHDQVR